MIEPNLKMIPWVAPKSLSCSSKIVIAYHSADNDGVFSATLVNYFCHKLSKITPVFVPLNYQPNWVNILADNTDDDTILFLVDISIKVEDVDTFINKVKYKEFIWIDHHDSSIDAVKTNDVLNNTYGWRSKEMSAAALTYDFFLPNMNNDNDYTQSLQSIHLRRLAELISDHDIFEHKLSNSISFFRGTRAHEGSHYPSSAFWERICNPSCSLLENVIAEGDVVTNFINNQTSHYEKNNIIKCTLHIIRPFMDELEFNFAIIYAPQADSFSFGKYYDECDFVMKCERTKFANGRFKYTLYKRDEVEKFNCQKFCEAFANGGGHKNSAGFTLPIDITDCKNCTVTKTMININSIELINNGEVTYDIRVYDQNSKLDIT